MAWYKTGTISVQNGQTAVTGVTTKFASNARVGDGFRAPDGDWYEIVNIASETVLGIYPSYKGVTVSNSANYTIAPLQGYNKESADRLRAITDSFTSGVVTSVNTRTGAVVLSKTDVGLGNVDNTSDANKPVSTAQLTALNAKQALNTNLTAFAGLTGVADRIPYFTGAGALSLSVLTAKARALNARTDTAGMQAELSLVPVTSFTDMTAGRLLTPGWLGLGDAMPITPGQNYNNLTQPGEYFYGSGTAPTNAPIVPAHLISVKGRGIYPYQEVRPIYGNDIWQRSAKVANPTTASADWNVWDRYVRVSEIGTAAALTATTSTIDTTDGRAARIGDHGFGSQVSPFISDMDTPLANGYSWVTSGTANPILGFASGSQVLTFFASANEIAQMYFSRTTPMRIGARRKTTGVWQAGTEIVTTAGAILDPALNTGGILSTSVVSGFRVDKYINGTMCVTGRVLTPSIAVNVYPYQTLTLPVTFFSLSNMQPQLTAAGSSSADCYGVAFQRPDTTSTILYAVRNGASTAQTFSVNVVVWGTWK